MSDLDDRDRPSGYFLALGGLVLVAVGLLVVPGLLAPTPRPTAKPTPTSDPHVVVTAYGVLSIALEGNTLVVRRIDVTPAQALGRVFLPDEMLPAASGGELNGSASFLLACPPPGGGSDLARILFGHVGFGGGVTYTGPPADGQAAPDGLYLYALRPGAVAESAVMDVKSSHGELGVPVSEFTRIATEATLQPSGCHASD